MGAPASHNRQPSRNFAAITPNDTVVLPGDVREVFCLTAGNLVVTNWGGVDLTIPLTAGQSVGINPKLVKTTSTGTYAALR